MNKTYRMSIAVSPELCKHINCTGDHGNQDHQDADWLVKGDGTEKRKRPKPLMSIQHAAPPGGRRYDSPVERIARKRVSCNLVFEIHLVG